MIFPIFHVRQRTICVIFWYSKEVDAKWIDVRIFCIISWPHYNSGHPCNHLVSSVFLRQLSIELCPKIIGRQFVWRLFEDYLRDCEVRPAYNYQSLEYTNLVLNRYKSWYRHLNKFVPESIFWIHRPGRKIIQKSQKIVK